MKATTGQAIQTEDAHGLGAGVYLLNGKPYVIALACLAFVFALLLTIVIETGARWAQNLIFISCFLFLLPVALAAHLYFKTVKHVEILVTDWKEDKAHRREIETQQVNILITGRVKNVNVNSTVDERRLLMKTDTMRWRAVPPEQAYAVDAIATPTIDPPQAAGAGDA